MEFIKYVLIIAVIGFIFSMAGTAQRFLKKDPTPLELGLKQLDRVKAVDPNVGFLYYKDNLVPFTVYNKDDENCVHILTTRDYLAGTIQKYPDIPCTTYEEPARYPDGSLVYD